jgi:ABC-2 type transport system permease protein
MQEEAPAYWTAETGEERQAELFAKYGVERKEDLPVDLRGAELDLAERLSHRVFDRVLGGFYDRVEAQDRLYATLSFLSPAAAMLSLSPALAGSDFSHHRQFIDSAERYRRALVNRMNAEVMARPANHDGPRYKADAAVWEQIPQFRYSSPDLHSAWNAATPALGALSLWLIGSAVLLHFAARRLRP